MRNLPVQQARTVGKFLCMTIYPFTMAKSLSENLSPGLEAYRSSPSEEFALESLPALPSSPTVSSDESDLPYFHRTSIQSVSTLCSEKDYETEQLLKDPDDSPTIVIRFPWYTRLKSFYTLRPIKFVVDGVWRLILVIIPSFLRPGPKRKLYPTSYLDGLRGVAAFFVVQVSKDLNSKCSAISSNDILGPSTSRCKNKDLSGISRWLLGWILFPCAPRNS